jgi:hypothetical protein
VKEQIPRGEPRSVKEARDDAGELHTLQIRSAG